MFMFKSISIFPQFNVQYFQSSREQRFFFLAWSTMWTQHSELISELVGSDWKLKRLEELKNPKSGEFWQNSAANQDRRAGKWGLGLGDVRQCDDLLGQLLSDYTDKGGGGCGLDEL